MSGLTDLQKLKEAIQHRKWSIAEEILVKNECHSTFKISALQEAAQWLQEGFSLLNSDEDSITFYTSLVMEDFKHVAHFLQSSKLLPSYPLAKVKEEAKTFATDKIARATHHSPISGADFHVFVTPPSKPSVSSHEKVKKVFLPSPSTLPQAKANPEALSNPLRDLPKKRINPIPSTAGLSSTRPAGYRSTPHSTDRGESRGKEQSRSKSGEFIIKSL